MGLGASIHVRYNNHPPTHPSLRPSVRPSNPPARHVQVVEEVEERRYYHSSVHPPTQTHTPARHAQVVEEVEEAIDLLAGLHVLLRGDDGVVGLLYCCRGLSWGCFGVWVECGGRGCGRVLGLALVVVVGVVVCLGGWLGG